MSVVINELRIYNYPPLAVRLYVYSDVECTLEITRFGIPNDSRRSYQPDPPLSFALGVGVNELFFPVFDSTGRQVLFYPLKGAYYNYRLTGVVKDTNGGVIESIDFTSSVGPLNEGAELRAIKYRPVYNLSFSESVRSTIYAEPVPSLVLGAFSFEGFLGDWAADAFINMVDDFNEFFRIAFRDSTTEMQYVHKFGIGLIERDSNRIFFKVSANAIGYPFYSEQPVEGYVRYNYISWNLRSYYEDGMWYRITFDSSNVLGGPEELLFPFTLKYWELGGKANSYNLPVVNLSNLLDAKSELNPFCYNALLSGNVPIIHGLPLCLDRFSCSKFAVKPLVLKDDLKFYCGLSYVPAVSGGSIYNKFEPNTIITVARSGVVPFVTVDVSEIVNSSKDQWGIGELLVVLSESNGVVRTKVYEYGSSLPSEALVIGLNAEAIAKQRLILTNLLKVRLL